MNLRPFQDADLEGVVNLFTESVHTLAADCYSEAQRSAWAPVQPNLTSWKARIAATRTLVAESGGELAGFISFELNGHIEFLYSSPRFARLGVASGLYREMEQYLESQGVTRRFTEASLGARRFFERQGLQVMEEQSVERCGVVLPRFAMSK